MSFELDFNDVYEGNSTIADGEYEAIIYKVAENATPNGAEYVQFDLIIRNDFDQKYQNCHIFHKIWKSKADGKYNSTMFNTIGKNAGLAAGKKYESLEELLKAYEGYAVRVFVRNEESEYKGKVYQNLNVKQWIPTRTQGPIRHQFKTKVTDQQTIQDMMQGTIEISDDDLPF